MKKYLYLFFALCVGAVVMSCKPTNAPDKGDKEFAFAAQYIIDYGTPAVVGRDLL